MGAPSAATNTVANAVLILDTSKLPLIAAVAAISVDCAILAGNCTTFDACVKKVSKRYY